MDVVLIILGILGLGAIVVSAYVFTVAARNYVSSDHKHHPATRVPSATRQQTMRSPTDRRSGRLVVFPLNVNGVLVPQERRHLPERRKAA